VLNHLRIINNNLFQVDSLSQNEFERLYISLRKKEGRYFTENEIVRLPRVGRSHPLFKEWKIRKKSCDHLLHYIKKQGRICNILEIGCGNGWLTAQLASVTKGTVTGIDVNRAELKKAKKVFQKRARINFLYGDIRSGILADQKFDLIVFAASIQYFKSLKEIVDAALQHLTLQGEIHFLDSPFYAIKEVFPARQRTRKYFSKLGFPQMSKYYFHHRLCDLKPYNYKILHNPHSWISKLMFRKNPFYWIVIQNNYGDV
jgi:ubiquinone/menaquinone biosynthesis C-methylase UbiE